MSDPPTEADPSVPADLVLDEIDEKFAAFQAFRKSDTDAADAILGSLGAQDDVDRDIVLELSSRRPLGHPQRFVEAHALAVRSLEVLDRNGARGVKVRGLGPLSPVAAYLTQQVAHFIVRSHQAVLADRMLRLYTRREANCAPDDAARRMLTRARMHMERLAPGFKRSVVGVPAFLLGGAVVSAGARVLTGAIAAANASLWNKIVAVVVVGLVVAGAAWVILRGAAVARRRIQLTTDRPMAALWQTIGRCGDPPQDPARAFALIALVLAALPWILIPVGLLVSWMTG